MRKLTTLMAVAAAAVMTTLAVTSMTSRAEGNYADDRAEIVRIDGNKATGRAYWFHYSNDNPKRAGIFDGFGHYEDDLVKVKGRWLFAKRRIYNENRDEWAYTGARNPAW